MGLVFKRHSLENNEKTVSFRELFLPAIVFIAFFVLRGSVFFTHPYPSSADVAGDLYGAQLWLGNPISSAPQSLLQPPLYYFLVVIPSTKLLGVFLGTKAYMTLIPALLSFPGYYLVKDLTKSKIFATGGSALLSGAASFSLMVTWNASYNLFGIFFLLFFIYTLKKAYAINSIRTYLLAGLSFSLVVGTHPLTALVSFAIFLFSAILLLGSSVVMRQSVKQTLYKILYIFGFMLLFSLPYSTIYYGIYSSSIFTGASYSSTLSFYYANLLNFPWGFQGVYNSNLLILDSALSVIGAISILKLPKESKAVFTGIGMSVLVLPFIESSNAIRFLYFGTVLFLPLTAFFFSIVESMLKRGGKNISFNHKMLTRKKSKLIATTVFVLFILVNSAYSYQVLNQSFSYNSHLNKNDVQVLNWVKDNTSGNSVIYDGAGLHTWVMGYSHRMDYAPSNLLVKVTKKSYSTAMSADLISIGNYGLITGSYALGFNFNSPIGNPVIYSLNSGALTELSLFNSAHLMVNMTLHHQTLTTPLFYSHIVSVESGKSLNYEWYNFTMNFNSIHAFLDFNATAYPSHFTIRVSSNDSQINSITDLFSILPNDYGFKYASVQNYNGTNLEDILTEGTTTYKVGISAMSVNQTKLSDGWTNVKVHSANEINISIHSSNNQVVTSDIISNTYSLLNRLNITYFIISSNDYVSFQRLYTNSLTVENITFNKVAQYGQYYIYRVVR